MSFGMSSFRRFVRPARAVRQYLLGLALLAFVLRALVPMGFMPGMDDHHGNHIVLTLCNPAGEETAFVLDLSSEVAHAGDAGSHELSAHGTSTADASTADASTADASTQDDSGMSAQHCPFCLVNAQAMLPAADIVLHVAALAASDVPVAVYVGPSPISAQGPPLGSRAPPTYLG